MFNCDASTKKQKERRFSDEQIRTLEAVFESETKLEPGKKVKLAKQLGLQPRQIAIWFQNKRARWKSKTVEKDYGLLLADYKILSSQYEALKKEKQSLLSQLKNETVGKSEENLCQSDPRNTSINVDFAVKDVEGINFVSDDDHSSSVEKVDPLGFEEEEEEEEAYQFLNSAMAEVVDVSSTSPLFEDLGSQLESDDMSDQLWFWS